MRRLFLVLGLLALAPGVSARTEVFAIEPGQPVPEDELPSLDGGPLKLLGAARVNVFVFVRTGQEQSVDALTRLARIEKELAGKGVRFVAVVSGDEPPAAVRKLVKDTGVAMPVLLDQGDVLYGKLGVRLHPVLGITDASHRLAAYEHYRRINMEQRVRAQIRRVLGEIGDAELAQALDPAAAPIDEGDAAKAALEARFARKLLEAGKVEQAVAMARNAVERAPRSTDAHAALAAALSASGDCAGAAKEQQLARAAAPKQEQLAIVTAGLRPCAAQ